jgi:hypothetical protein
MEQCGIKLVINERVFGFEGAETALERLLQQKRWDKKRPSKVSNEHLLEDSMTCRCIIQQVLNMSRRMLKGGG